MFHHELTRRSMLGGMAALTAGSLAGLGRPGRSRAGAEDGPRFLIVLCASGGASIIDSVLAIRESEAVAAGADPSTLNCFPDELVPQLDPAIPFRAVDTSGQDVGPIPISFSANQSSFVSEHHHEMMVATMTGTSVNHAVAQRRAITGNEAFHGRTLQESVALTYGESFPLPNVHLVSGTGFTERGGDSSLPPWAYGEQVADPALWPLALDGLLGTSHPVERADLQTARALRNDVLDPSSKFTQAFGASRRLRKWAELRGEPQAAVEQAGLIDKLMYVPDSGDYPLGEHGLQSSPDAALVRSAFPNYDWDPLHAQAALAFLLLKNRVSVTVTLGPAFDLVLDDGVSLGGGQLPEGSMANPPIGFDFSHQGHRNTQAFMWNRIYEVAHGLIDLLRNEEWDNGTSMWDRTMIYVATDFGRTKRRSASADFGTGHDLNNGVLLVSPLVAGNTVRGGVDYETGETYGFNPSTGTADPSRQMTEPEIHSGILGALGIDTGGALPSVPAMSSS